MAASKVEAAEALLNPSLIWVLNQLQHDTQSLTDLATSDALKGIITDLANAASTALLLEELITWLIETNPIEFWIGLFGALAGGCCLLRRLTIKSRWDRLSPFAAEKATERTIG
jgi:hypothetical protein